MNLFELFVKIGVDDKASPAMKNTQKNSETLTNKIKVMSAQFESAQKNVDKLTKEFNDSVEKTGATSKETQELAKKLDNAEKEAEQAKKALDGYNSEIEETGTKSEKASAGLSNFASKLGKGVATAAKVGVAAVGAASAAIVGLTKSVVENYAEYEQLVGGVQTLFEDLSFDVQQNAGKAFETAGLSANEYMNTAMSFAASLNQSLLATEGNIARSADLTDQAIIDMADNANKMGTNMEMIQNAYQGFAKQNYTMLDNLKLGYGGTKEEMQRLLEDAEKISGIKYDISSYADIVDAIHVVQTEMGITGTTAKEAGTTIQGSVSSMKSAWTNLLTGLADGNADIEQLVDNLVTTIVGDGTENNLGVFGNILPAIETALGGAAKLIEGVAPKIVKIFPGLVKKVVPSLISAATGMVKAVIAVLPDLMNTVVDALVDNAPALITAAIGLVQSLIQGIQDNYQILVDGAIQIVTQLATGILDMLPEIVQLGLDVIVSLANGIADSLPELIPTIIDVILQIVDTLTDPKNLRNLLDAALAVIEALAEGLIENIDKLVDATFTIIENLVEFLLDPENIEKLLECALKIVLALGKGLIDAIPKLLGNVGELVGSIVDKIFETDWLQVGEDIVFGILDGLKEAWGTLTGWLSDALESVADGIRGLLGIGSADFVHVTDDGHVKIDAPFDFGGLEDSLNESLDDSRKSGQSVRALRSIIGAIGDKTGLDDLIPDIGAPLPKFGLDDTSLNIDKSVRRLGRDSLGMNYVGASAGNTSINIEINGAQYKDEDALAEAISYRLQELTERRSRA